MKKFIPALALMFATFPAHADITWAVAGPYTGAIASIGLAQQAGIRQAVEDINMGGGVDGQRIVLKTYDDACDPKQAVSVANKIISANIHIVMHGSCSAASLAAVKTYSDEGALVVNPLSSNPKITDGGEPRMFRMMYRDDASSVVLADELLKHYKKARIAILHDKSAYGLGIAEYVRDRVNKEGLKEALFEPYDPSNHDYSSLVARLKQSGVDAVFVGGYPIEIGLITRQLREAGSKIGIIAGDLSEPDYWRVAGKTGEGTLFAFTSDPRKVPGARVVLDKLQKSGVIIDGYTLYAYAAAQVLAQAIARAGDTEPGKVAAVIHKDEFVTILGKWSFDEKGDVRNIRQKMYRWHDGQFEETEE